MTISSNLASGARRALRAAAHHLDPVVMIGEKGLTASVLHEIDVALTAHALIKVRVASDDREQRIAFMNEICEKMGCESVQHLGKLLVLWRNKEDGSNIDFDDDGDAAEDAPVSRSRGPRSKLASEKDAGFRRPTERDPKPREGRDGRVGGAGYGARKPAYGDRKPAFGDRGGYGRSSEGGGYSRARTGGDGSAPRGGAYPRGSQGGYSQDGADRGGYKRRDASESGGAHGRDGGSENRRYRRSDEAPPPDTRTPREGWAPRERRGVGRASGTGADRNAGNTRDDRSPPSDGFARGRSRGDAGAGSNTGFGGSGFQDRGRPPRGRSTGTGRAPSGEGRWGARGGSSSGGGAAATPKPRARRRLG
jgi:RNA-binding protein